MFIRLIVFLGILGCSLRGLSQQNEHFIYLQSENKQPFYVKVGQGPLSLTSSKSGYLILPKVPEGQCFLSVGFPDSTYPEQHFTCPITSDKGYLLKRFPDKGWALYDLQELTLIYAVPASKSKDSTIQAQPAAVHDSAVSQPVTQSQPTPGQATQEQGGGQNASPGGSGPSVSPVAGAATAAAGTALVAAPGVGPGSSATTSPASVLTSASADTTPTVTDTTPTPPQDSFGELLSAATKDSTLKDIKAYKKPVPPPAPQVVRGAAAVVPAGAVAVSAKAGKATAGKTAAAKGAQPVKGAGITLLSREDNDAGIKLTFAVKQKTGKMDTVQVLIPAPIDSSLAVQVKDSAHPGDTAVAANAPAIAVTSTPTTPPNPPAPVAGGASPGPAILPAATAVTAAATGNGSTPDSSGKTVPATTPATPVDTTQAFNPSSLQGTSHKADTGNLVVPVFKQPSGAAPTQGTPAPNSLAALAAGAGITQNSGSANTQNTVPQASQPAATQGDTAKASSLSSGFGVQQGPPPVTAAAVPVAAVPASGAIASDGHLANTDCQHIATDDDYMKIRKRMAAESSDDSMIAAAKKAFKKTCVTTEQVRNLSFLFSGEDGKYQFVEQAYPHVSDAWNYKSLQALFTTNYFIGRFKALVEQR